jgi:hypothetical protein
LFTGKGEYCPDELLCYCEGYGLCYDEAEYRRYFVLQKEVDKLEEEIQHLMPFDQNKEEKRRLTAANIAKKVLMQSMYEIKDHYRRFGLLVR